jgi:sarcosine oxidase
VTAPHTIVAGLGAVGSSTAWRLALAGHRVTALDKWAPPHGHGSTHGETRVTRITAWEGAQYVPLARRAHALWDELERESGRKLHLKIGGLFVGPPEDRIIAGSRESALAARAEFEMIDADAIRQRIHGLHVPDGHVGFVDPAAGVLLPEPILESLHAILRAKGAELRYDEPLLSWRADGAGVRVETARGVLTADFLVLATGAWMAHELEPLGISLKAERQTMHWFEDSAATPADRSRPVLILADGHDHATVVFPERDGMVKAAGHGVGRFIDPDRVRRHTAPEDVEPVMELMNARFPERSFRATRGAACLYTRTPDGHFIIDRHTKHPQVLLASPCNGFGFKFSSAVGEGLAALVCGAPLPVDLTAWRLKRAR